MVWSEATQIEDPQKKSPPARGRRGLRLVIDYWRGAVNLVEIRDPSRFAKGLLLRRLLGRLLSRVRLSGLGGRLSRGRGLSGARLRRSGGNAAAG